MLPLIFHSQHKTLNNLYSSGFLGEVHARIQKVMSEGSTLKGFYIECWLGSFVILGDPGQYC